MTALVEPPAAAPTTGALPPHGDRARRDALMRRRLPACTCGPCGDAHRTYENHRSRQKAYGRWEPFVDAEPARAHARALVAAGVGWRHIARRAGISKETFRMLLNGRDGRPPSRKVRPETAAAILAIRADDEGVAGGIHVRATGMQRRLRALCAIGYEQKYLAKRLGRDDADISRWILHATKVRASTAEAVAALYDQLSMTPGPSSLARQTADRRGWQPPLAWDDDTIDDPKAEPTGTEEAEIARLMRGNPDAPIYLEAKSTGEESRLAGHRPALVEAVRRLTAGGMSDAKISELLGGRLTRGSVQTLRRRNGIPAITAAQKTKADPE